MKTLDFILEQRELNIDDLVGLCGLAKSRVEAITYGRWTPSPTERKTIADALKIEVTDVFWGHYMEPRVVRYRRDGFKKDFQ